MAAANDDGQRDAEEGRAFPATLSTTGLPQLMGTRSAREPADRRLQSEIGHLVTTRTRVSTLFGPQAGQSGSDRVGGSSRHCVWRPVGRDAH